MIFSTPLWPVDNLSLFMLVMIAGLFPFVLVFSLGYVRRNFFRYYFVLLVTLAGMLGTVLARDLLSFYIFLEIMTVGIYFLIIDNKKKESFPAGFKYILMMFSAGILILLAALMFYNMTGTFELAAIARAAPQLPASALSLASALFLIGCLIELGTVPFHIWLPDAHPVAPSPVSALLSGLSIKIGAYGIIRLIFTLNMTAPLLVVLGAAAMLFGAALALRQTNVKRLLAYHSISQMGYVLLGIGLGTGLGAAGAIFHIFNHAMFKTLLFLCMGAVIYAARERDLDRLGGLGRRMPLTMAATAFAALAISGIPPFNGFASKALLSAAVAGRPWLGLVLLLTAAGTAASFYKLFRHVFLGELPEKLDKVREVPRLMAWPLLGLSALCLAGGLFSTLIVRRLVLPAAGRTVDFQIWSLAKVLPETLLIVILGLGIYELGRRLGFLEGGGRSFLSLDRLCCAAAGWLEKGCHWLKFSHARSVNVHLLWMVITLVILLWALNFHL